MTKIKILILLLFFGGMSGISAQKKPNILVIFGDDIGQSNISAYTHGLMGYQTPNIDRMAKEGIMFTDYYAENSCTAGRATFITGQSCYRTGLSKVGMPGAPIGLQARDITIAQALKPLGYATGQFGKNHLGDLNKYLPTVHGFDEFFGNLYHLNAEEEPEDPNYPYQDTAFAKSYMVRGVLKCKATTVDDPKVDPRFGRVGKQIIEDSGPLTKKRMRAETGNRPHAVNANFGYDIWSPKTSNKVLKQVVDGWRVTGTAQLYSGAAMAPSCGFTGNPVGYPNGTPTGSVLFRCQMTKPTLDGSWLPSGAKPSDVGSTADPKLWYPIDPNNFQLPKNYAPFSMGMIGNEVPVLTYGPGLELFNLSLQKEFKIKESQRLQFKIESTNAFNHFNPSNPNMTITRNYTTGANTNAAFGTIQGTQYQSRRAIASVRYAF